MFAEMINLNESAIHKTKVFEILCGLILSENIF